MHSGEVDACFGAGLDELLQLDLAAVELVDVCQTNTTSAS